jgi:GAF domain-containing protein
MSNRRRLDGGDQGAEVPASPAPERGQLNAAVAAAALGSEERFRKLLRSVVDVARAIFAAKASSVLLLDEETSELVFEAVVGEGEEDLVGKRFPAGTGVAGWVLATRTPLVIEDVARDPRFAKDVAEDTGYVPQGLMAVPLLHDERALGVLEVLDRQSRFTLEEMELLGLFASQAAIALDLLQRARLAEAALTGDGDLAVVARVAAALAETGEDERPEAQRLLEALEAVLRRK